MNNVRFTHYDINSIYLMALSSLAHQPITTAPRGMRISEHLNASVNLLDASRCLVSLPERRLNYHFAVAEFWWIATGRSDVESIAAYMREIAKFSDDGISFFGAYGPRWRAQIGPVVKKLRSDSDSRQAVITTWRPEVWAHGDTKDYPCTISTQYLVRDGKLNAIVTMRSWDAWLGMAYDVFNFARLQAIVAGELHLPVGWLTVNAGSLHLYERNLVTAQALLRAYGGVHHPEHPSRPLPALPGFVPDHLASLPMTEVISKLPLEIEATSPWYPYLAVLRHKHDKSLQLSSPFCELVNAVSP